MTRTSELKKEPIIVWEKLPEDFLISDEPVENICQPLLAAALTEALDLGGLITPHLLIASNLGICAKVDGQTVIKAPDWFYVPRALPLAEGVIRRSYTPYLEGDVPLIVMEFISETDAGEYSIRPTYPYGKMWFYERIVQVPLYIIFYPSSGMLEVLQLQDGRYEVQPLDALGRYFIPALGLSLGVWLGKRLEIQTNWLRWWDDAGNLLLWGSERIEQERQRAETAEQEIVRLRELLKQAGITETEGDSQNIHL
jgi:Uma2 family endonuclease